MTYLVLVVVERLDAFFLFDVPQFDQSIRSRRDELHARRQKVEPQNGICVAFESL
jgi:hypothetical protein